MKLLFALLGEDHSKKKGTNLLYLHVEKTGGSTLECATQETLVPMGYWSNMGHTWSAAVASCKQACHNAKIVLCIREPYSWWRSFYRYGWVCEYATMCASGRP